MSADIISMMRRRGIFEAHQAGHFHTRTLSSGLPVTNLSYKPTQPLGEQVEQLGVKVFAPSVAPIFQEIEKLEESPNISEGTRNLLELAEVVILGYCAYNAVKWLSN